MSAGWVVGAPVAGCAEVVDVDVAATATADAAAAATTATTAAAAAAAAATAAARAPAPHRGRSIATARAPTPASRSDFNVPKIVSEDAPIFLQLVRDLFPGLEVQPRVNTELRQRCVEVCRERGLSAEDEFLLKVAQLHELLLVRHSVMLLGPAGCGKTTVWRSLAGCLNQGARKAACVFEVIEPKVLSPGELYGGMTLSKEWRDGVLSIMCVGAEPPAAVPQARLRSAAPSRVRACRCTCSHSLWRPPRPGPRARPPVVQHARDVSQRVAVQRAPGAQVDRAGRRHRCARVSCPIDRCAAGRAADVRSRRAAPRRQTRCGSSR